MRRMLALTTMATLALAGCNSEPEARTKTLRLPKISIRDARVQPSPVAGRPAVGYFTLRARADATLDGISSPAAEHIELHETRTEGGVARMGMLENLRLAQGDVVRFEPGGKHLMLFGLSPTVQAGRTISLTFIFSDLPPVTVEAKVQAPGGGG